MTYSNGQDKPRAFFFSYIALTLAALSAAGRLFSLLFFYDKIAYYQSGAILPIASNTLFVLSLVFFGISAIFFIKPGKTIPTPSGAAKYAAFLPALALAVYLVPNAMKLTEESADLVDSFSILFAISSVVFFVSLYFCRQPSLLSILTGIPSIFWLALTWLRSYRDFTIPMNSPDKIFFHLGCLGAVIFIFSEIRAIYGIARPRFYYFSLFTAILSLAVSSIPSLIGNACGIFASYSLTLEDIFFLALCAYAIARLFTILPELPTQDQISEEISPEANENEASAEDTEEEKAE